MKKAVVTCLALFLFTGLLGAQSNTDIEKEKAAIQKVIDKAYIQGVFIKRDAEAMAKGFHADFNMLLVHDDHMHAYPISKWIESTKKNKEKNPNPPKEKFTYKIPLLDVTGYAAIAKIEIYRDSKHIYSDYMSLYKFGDSWQIVNKIFYEHK